MLLRITIIISTLNVAVNVFKLKTLMEELPRDAIWEEMRLLAPNCAARIAAGYVDLIPCALSLFTGGRQFAGINSDVGISPDVCITQHTAYLVSRSSSSLQGQSSVITIIKTLRLMPSVK